MRASMMIPTLLALTLAGCLDPPPPEDAPSTVDMAVDGNPECSGSIEVCNGVDDDCDGLIDEAFNLQEDEANCGVCGNDCGALSNADARCDAGECAVTACDDGFIKCDGDVGCETLCVPVGEELSVCNGIDEDCDCKADEAVPVEDDVNNCGGCNIECVTRFNADPGCVERSCVIAACDDGFFNPDGQIETGCRCNHLTAVVDLALPVAPFPDTIRVSFPGDGGDGVLVSATAEDGGLIIDHLSISVDGRPTGPLARVELERAPNARLVDVRSLGGGRHAVIWSSAGDLRVRRLGDVASTVLFDACDLNNGKCAYTVVDGEVVAARHEVRGMDETAATVFMTSGGQQLGLDIDGHRNDVPIQSMACTAPGACLALYRDGDALMAASVGNRRVLEADAISDVAPAIALDGNFLVVWAAEREGAEVSLSATLDGAAAITRGPHLLNLEGVVNTRSLLSDGESVFLFWVNDGGMTGYVNLRLDGTQVSDSASFAFSPSGFALPRTLYGETGRIEAFDGPIIDGIPWPDSLGERMSIAGHIDGDDAILVFDAQNGDFVVRVNDAGEVSPAELLFTHRGGPLPVQLERVGETLFALRVEPGELVWATHADATPVQIHRTRVGEVDAEPSVTQAALMRWGDGVLAALATVVDGQMSQLQLLPIAGPDAIPEALPLALEDGGQHAAPQLAGPGPGQGALLVTNWIKPDEPGTELRLYLVSPDGTLGAHDPVGRLTTRGLHAAVHSPISGRTFVALADDLRGGACARGLGVQVFDEALVAKDAPPGGLDLRERVKDLEVLGERCITGVVAVPNQGGGLTVALEVGDADFWLVNFSRDGLPMGDPRRWSTGSPRHDLALWPRGPGARAYWHRRDGVLRQAHLGCE